jgi:hypothetical protein
MVLRTRRGLKSEMDTLLGLLASSFISILAIWIAVAQVMRGDKK